MNMINQRTRVMAFAIGCFLFLSSGYGARAATEYSCNTLLSDLADIAMQTRIAPDSPTVVYDLPNDYGKHSILSELEWETYSLAYSAERKRVARAAGFGGGEIESAICDFSDYRAIPAKFCMFIVLRESERNARKTETVPVRLEAILDQGCIGERLDLFEHD